MMKHLETNIYPIVNLGELSSRYRLHRIRGLSPSQDEYERNVQILTRKLSFLLRSPAAVILHDGEPHLILQEGSAEPPSPYPLVRATTYFDPTDLVLTLDYEHPSAETEVICLRFLQFAVEGGLHANPAFWQPGAGRPFFERLPVSDANGVCVYRGYAIRVVKTESMQFGLCVDVQHAYVSKNPLPAQLSREDFRRFKHARCVYHYGRQWYEIQLHDHGGLTVAEQLIPDGSQPSISLLQYITKHAPNPLPREVVDLDPNSPAVSYLTTRDEVHWAAAALCYPVFETSDPRVGRAHSYTILQPGIRRSLIQDFAKSHLTPLRAKDMTLQVAPSPITVPKAVFLPPDLAFGHDAILSVRGTPGATYVGLDQLGRARLAALFDHEMGPYANRPLDRQYIVLPQSVVDSYGPAFLKDLKAVVDDIYPQELPYDPTLIVYDDQGTKSFAVQGRAILAAVDQLTPEPGYGMAMIHETVDRKRHQHDELAAMVMRELRRRQLYISVIHTAVPRECYRIISDGTGYEQTSDRQRQAQLQGYLRNVAITKVLLTNELWPFVLATPLHADLTVAIDVQLHAACFTFVGRSGPDIRTVQTTSNQKEQLSRQHVQQALLDVLRQEVDLGRKGINTLVIQRDGRLHASEIRGVKDAIGVLKKEGMLPSAISVAFVEIPKTSAVPFRLFDVEARPGSMVVQNSPVGGYTVISAQDGYICSTGREFRHPGTANPLHVRYVEGMLPFEHILEDVYALTCLAWTRPEDCTRYPITIKLTDIRLREHAGGYDEDALEYGGEGESDDGDDDE